MNTPLRILLVDDHTLFRSGLKALLQRQADLDVIGEAANGVMGIGGWNPDSDVLKAYIQRHVAMFKREPDRWGSSMMYAGLQAMGQAIEKVGLNNAEIVKQLRGNSFDTVLGKLDFDQNNIRKGGWFVGQWQDGDFYGIAPDLPGVHRTILPKPAWKS